MQFQRHKTGDNVTGYVMKLSANDTYRWAHRAGASWPGSTTSGNRLVICVDSAGLCDLTMNGRDGEYIDGAELESIVSDHLPPDCRHLWPSWN